MSPFAYRIVCETARCPFRADSSSTTLSITGIPPFRVFLPEPDGNGDRRGALVLRGEGFDSEVHATEAGRRLKDAVLLAAVSLGIGIDVGLDRIKSHAPRRTDGVQDDRLQPNVHGLHVYPEIAGVRFGFVELGAVETPTTTAELEAKLQEALPFTAVLTPKLRTAARLYAQSHFRENDEGALVVLITALELMADRQSRSKKAREAIDDMIALATDRDLGGELPALLSALETLRTESIRNAGRRLVQLYGGGEKPLDTFESAYAVRSALTHSGIVPKDTDLGATVREIDTLVRVVLTKVVSARYSRL